MAQANIVIRPLEAADEPSWRRLWAEYLAFYQTSRPDEVFRTTFQRLIGDDPRDFSALVAVVGGQPRGLAHYLFHRHGWQVGETCYLQDLYVEPAARGAGIGRRLMDAVFDAADTHGAETTYWLTQDFNTTARRLYDRVGQVTPFIKYNREQK